MSELRLSSSTSGSSGPICATLSMFALLLVLTNESRPVYLGSNNTDSLSSWLTISAITECFGR